MSKPDAPEHVIPRVTEREDRRHPRALMPYVVLWVTCAVCVIFAVFELLQQA